MSPDGPRGIETGELNKDKSRERKEHGTLLALIFHTYRSYFTQEETEFQVGKVTCLRSPSLQMDLNATSAPTENPTSLVLVRGPENSPLRGPLYQRLILQGNRMLDFMTLSAESSVLPSHQWCWGHCTHSLPKLHFPFCTAHTS